MSWMRTLTIKWKMVLVTSGLMAAIAVTTLWTFANYLTDSLRDGWRAKVEAVAAMLGAAIEPAVHLGQVSDEDEMFVGARRDPALVAIQVEDIDGQRLVGPASLEPSIAANMLQPGRTWIGPFDQERLQAALLIVAAGNPVGVLRLTYSLEGYHAKEAAIWRVGSLVALGIFLIGSALAYLFGHGLTAPMRKMAVSFAQMAGGDLSQAPLEDVGSGEVGQLAQAYNRLLVQLRELSDNARHITQGDLTQSIESRGDLADAFRAMADALTTLFTSFDAMSTTIDERTSEILATAKQQEAGAAQQAAAVSEVTATMGELAATARQISLSAESVTKASDKAADTVEQGRGALVSLSESISRIQTGNQTINENIVRLNRHVQQIGGIIDIIDDIADKSDLLALNAALEGTKAGEAGKGFLLVAAEMRRLAENVFQSTAEVKQLIAEVVEASNSTVMATESGMKATSVGVELASDTESVFDLIVGSMEETTRAAKQIFVATQQQHVGTDQVVAALGEVSEVSQHSLEGISQTTRSVSELSGTASELRRILQRYRIT